MTLPETTATPLAKLTAFLAIGLGACTNMTLRIYAGFKGIDVGRLSVEVRHDRIHSRDCLECGEELASKDGKIDRFERIISVDGPVDAELERKLLEIAGASHACCSGRNEIGFRRLKAFRKSTNRPVLQPPGSIRAEKTGSHSPAIPLRSRIVVSGVSYSVV